MLFSTGLSQVVDTSRAAAMLFSTTCDRPVVNRGKRLMKLRVYPLYFEQKMAKEVAIFRL